MKKKRKRKRKIAIYEHENVDVNLPNEQMTCYDSFSLFSVFFLVFVFGKSKSKN